MIKMILFLCSASSMNAMADLSGTWNGNGKAYDNSGYEVGCKITDFTIEHSALMLKITKGDFQCGPMFWNWSDVNLNIVGEELQDKGKSIGTLKGDAVHLNLLMPSGKRNKIVDFALNSSGELSFHEENTDKDGVFLIVDSVMKK